MTAVKRLKKRPKKSLPRQGDRPGGVQVIARSADILRALARFRGMSLADVAEAVDLPRSTVHRIILALEAEGFVSSNGPGQYRLGPEVSTLAEAAKTGVLRALHPYLERLSSQVNETVDLSIRNGHSATFVDQIVAMRRLRAVSALGKDFPLHCTANGKAILAALPEDFADGLIQGSLEQLTPRTITSAALLKKQLGEIRRSGIAYDREEHTIGICAVGSAITVGSEVVAISIPMPAGRFFDQEGRLSASLTDALAAIVRDFPGSGLCFPKLSALGRKH